MNGKTAKLLRRFASLIPGRTTPKRKYREMKDAWKGMNQRERTKARNEMKAVIKRIESQQNNSE